MLLVVACSAMIGCGDTDTTFGVSPEIPPPATPEQLEGAELRVVEGDGQEGEVATLLDDHLVVEVVTSTGQPLGGAPVEWVFEAGYPTTNEGIALPTQRLLSMTDANGRSSTRWRLGELAGEQYVSVTIAGQQAPVPVSEPGEGPSSASIYDYFLRFFSRATAGVPYSISVAPTTTSLMVGDSSRFSAAVRDRYGNVLQRTVSWTSSASSVATIRQDGMAHAVATGSSTISAAYDTLRGYASLTSTATTSTLPTLTLRNNGTPVQALNLVVGASATLTVTAVSSSGANLGTIAPSWSSTNAGVATVSSQGVVQARSPGSANIVASYQGATAMLSTTVTAQSSGSANVGMVFASDFGTATGTSSTALLDTGKSRRWSSLSTGNTGVLRIESAAAAGLAGEWPSVNVRRVVGIATSTPAQSSRLTNGNGIIPEMTGDGQDVFYRWYIQVPDSAFPASDNTNHNIENGNVSQNWMFRTVIQNNGTYLAGFEFEGTAWPNNRFYPPAALRKGETYRIELRVIRQSNTTFQAQARIYNYAGTLLYEDDDFRNVNGSASLANAPLLTFANVGVMDELQAGINGIAADVSRSFTYWFDGAYAVCLGNWCGPYTAAEAAF